ncbi:PilX N-terminal domain-containing pilus assembly protein [Massilia sp. W12]|uniref:pilus assembly PilX family protein n=1 Tax=Massilia sp. W12 TaxID=3126507 RepID=UPI0030CCA847
MKYSLKHQQHGVVLPVVLIFMVVMMLLGVSAVRNITLEEKMAANSRSQNLAFQAAEQALRSCEVLLQQGQVHLVRILPRGPVEVAANKFQEYWEIPANWNGANSFAVPISASEAQLNNVMLAAERPRCMVELMDPVVSTVNPQDQKEQLRITARGVGARNTSVVILQSYIVLL